jgi:hypothetical protein
VIGLGTIAAAIVTDLCEDVDDAPEADRRSSGWRANTRPPAGFNEQFRNHLEQSGMFEDVNLGLQRVLDRLNGA